MFADTGLIQTTAVLIFYTAFVKGQHGYVNNDGAFGHTRYMNEQFRMYCNSSTLLVNSSDYITWETPHKDILAAPFNDNNYELVEWFGVEGFELHIKSITTYTTGVYICRVGNKNNHAIRGRGIIGLYIHEHKYDDLFDKYRDNLVRAFIASGVFLVLALATGFLCHYSWRSDHREHEMTDYNSKVFEQYSHLKTNNSQSRNFYDNSAFMTKL